MSDWLDGRVAWKKTWNDTLFSLGIDADLAHFEAGQFVRVALDRHGERLGRPYSLVNAPTSRPLEIFFNLVPGGPLSPELARLVEGDRIWLHARANGLLTLSEIPDGVRDLWLFATGTGIGPFLSMLRTGAAWDRFEKVILAYGVRWARDLAYQAALAEFEADQPGQFRYIPLVTGEAFAGGPQCRITDALEDGRLEALAGRALHTDSSHLMLCGRQEMITDVSALLEPRGFRRHRRREPGHISIEKYH